MPIKTIEKLINELGTTKVLNERLLYLKDQFVAHYGEISTCRKKISALTDMVCKLESENQNLKHEIRALNEKMGNFQRVEPQGYQCRHCSSVKLKRTGAKQCEMFGDICKVDTYFTCID